MNKSTKVLTLVTALFSIVGILGQFPYAVYSQNETEGIGGVTDPCERDGDITDCKMKMTANSTGQNSTDATGALTSNSSEDEMRNACPGNKGHPPNCGEVIGNPQ